MVLTNTQKAVSTVAALIFTVCAAFAVAAGIQPAHAYADDDVITLEYAGGVSDDTTKLTVSKLDYNTHEYVRGATLAILDRSGNELVRWVTDGTEQHFDKVLNENTPLNVETDYILREITAPEGFSKAGDVVFRIDSYGTLSIVEAAATDAEVSNDYTLYLYDRQLVAERTEMVYEQQSTSRNATNTVSTGDNTMTIVAVIGGVALVAAAIVAVLVVRKRRS